MSRANLDVVRASTQAFVEGDMERLATFYAPNASITAVPEGWPEAGPFEGRDAVMRQFVRLQEDWERQSVEIKREAAERDWVLAELRWNTRGAGSGVPLAATVIAALHLEAGKITEARYYWGWEEALEAVGMTAPTLLDARGLYAQPRNITRVEDCFFYHVMELPDVGLVGGVWDLREGVDQYLGGVDVSGKRVLEIGPASGFLTMHLESCGAEVVAHELSARDEWDVVPHHDHVLSIEEMKAARFPVMKRMRNSFWLTHRLFGSSARVHYGNAYELPDELGRFDVTTIASVLLHTRDPLRIVERCAQLTDEAIVIVELHEAALDGTPVCLLLPSEENQLLDIWWKFSPDLFVQYLGVLGFPNAEVTFHQQPYRPDPDAPETVPIDLFTVVARR